MSTYYYLNTELDTRFDIWKKDLDKLKDFTGSEEEKFILEERAKKAESEYLKFKEDMLASDDHRINCTLENAFYKSKVNGTNEKPYFIIHLKMFKDSEPFRKLNKDNFSGIPIFTEEQENRLSKDVSKKLTPGFIKLNDFFKECTEEQADYLKNRGIHTNEIITIKI